MSLKKFIVRKGRLEKIYFGIGFIFVGGVGWLRKVMSDEKFN